MRKLAFALVAAGCLALFAGTLSISIPGQVDLQAQTCDPKKDPKCEPPKDGCSPGYWKNHPADFNAACALIDSGSQCESLWTAVNCKGADAGCGRSAAAAALNEVSGCTE